MFNEICYMYIYVNMHKDIYSICKQNEYNVIKMYIELTNYKRMNEIIKHIPNFSLSTTDCWLKPETKTDCVGTCTHNVKVSTRVVIVGTCTHNVKVSMRVVIVGTCTHNVKVSMRVVIVGACTHTV